MASFQLVMRSCSSYHRTLWLTAFCWCFWISVHFIFCNVLVTEMLFLLQTIRKPPCTPYISDSLTLLFEKLRSYILNALFSFAEFKTIRLLRRFDMSPGSSRIGMRVNLITTLNKHSGLNVGVFPYPNPNLYYHTKHNKGHIMYNRP